MTNSAAAVVLPRASAQQFTYLADGEEIVCDSAYDYLWRARRDQGALCGPRGWIFNGGTIVAGPAGPSDWEVLEIGYDSGRGTAVLRGFNRCTGEDFSWHVYADKVHYDARYGFHHAHVIDERGLRFLQRAGFALA